MPLAASAVLKSQSRSGFRSWVRHSVVRHWDAAWLAIAAVFLADGLAFGVWVTQLPLLKRGLGLSDLAVAAALAGLVGGAFVAMPLAGAVATRLGSRRLTRVAAVAASLALALPGWAPSLPLLVAAAAALGLARGMTEVPMNAQASLLEVRDGRARMSSFHGCFSLGGFLGACIGSALLSCGVPTAASLTGVGVLLALACLAATGRLLHDEPGQARRAAEQPSHPAPLRDGTLLALGVLAFLGLFGEGAMADWSALLLERTTGAGQAAAALGYAAYSVAMMLGRFSGDWVVSRLGRRRALRWSGSAAAAGMAAALVAPYWLAVLGFGVVGIGYANLVPILFSAGGKRAGGAGIAAVSTLGYAGFVVGPPCIGALSALSGSLPLALAPVAAFGVAIALGAGAVEQSR